MRSMSLLFVSLLSLASLAQIHGHSQQPLSNQEDDKVLRPYFESPEHASIGDQVTLRYPQSTVKGSDLYYPVRDRKLSFGDVVMLAGDFFYESGTTSCPPSISGEWIKSERRGMEAAASNVALLRDAKSYLDCVLDTIYEQRDEIQSAVKAGEDVAQAYHKSDDHYNKKYFKCNPFYVALAICNYDHFGEDSANAYTALHKLALEKAEEASSRQNAMLLKEAYFIEAYGQHFLTDMFASGHIRAPRRILHSSSFSIRAIFPGDKCAQRQHGEDGANGLWVTNQEGQSWSAYGDKQLLHARSGKNRQMVSEAAQVSVDEIWNTFATGKAPKVNEYKALRKTPLPEKAFGLSNFVPLFEKNSASNTTFWFREIIDNRATSKDRSEQPIDLDNSQWKVLLTGIEQSGPTLNTFALTKGFLSDQKFLHLGQVDSSSRKVVTNVYGLVDAGTFGSNWGMSSQGLTDIATTTKKRRWTAISSLGDGLFSLVGREMTGGKTSNALHIGIKVSESAKGTLESKMTWIDKVNDDNSGLIPGQVLYGESGKGQVMIKFFDGNGQDKYSKLEFWGLSPKGDAPPTKLDYIIQNPELRVNSMLFHKIDKADKLPTLVCYAGGVRSTGYGTWFFFGWQEGSNNPQYSTKLTIPNALIAQALLSDPSSGRIVRLLYGVRFPKRKTLRIEAVKPVRNSENTHIGFEEQVIQQEYDITWRGYLEEDYQLWFVHDVDGDGYSDLVTYVSDASNLVLHVVVFPGQASGEYRKIPVVSLITSDDYVDKLLTAEFMRPIHTAQTTYTYPGDSGKKTSAAIVSFFDNYGIVGARIVAPVKPGSFEYELKGQDPAIAGQRSWTLGQTPAGFMGSEKKAQALGIVAF